MAIVATSRVPYQSSLLPTGDQASIDLGGDVGATVAAMMLQYANETRDATKVARQAEEKNIQAQQDRQVQAMRDQADDIRAAGWSSGLAEIGAGALGVWAGERAINGATFDSGPLKGQLKPEVSGTIDQLNGAGKFVSGTGEMFGAEFKADAQNDETDGVAAGQRSDAGKRRLEDLNDAEKDAKDLARTAIDFYRDTVHTNADADRAAVSIRV